MNFIDVGFKQSCSYDDDFYYSKTIFYGITSDFEIVKIYEVKEIMGQEILQIKGNLTKKELEQIAELYNKKYNNSTEKTKVKKREMING